MRTVTLLGSTGSIGTNTLDVIRRSRHLYEVYGLAAGRSIEILASQIQEFRPKVVALATQDAVTRLSERLAHSPIARGEWPELIWGDAARVGIATAPEVDTVISAIVGVAGLEAKYEAVRRGKRGGVANKKGPGAGGARVLERGQESGGALGSPATTD